MAYDVRREMVTVTAKNIILMIGVGAGVIGTLAIETALLLIVWLMVREREDDDE